MLRNRISAQKSRNKKKEEFGELTTQIEVLNKKYEDLYEIIDSATCTGCKEKIAAGLHAYNRRHLKKEEYKVGI